MALKALQTARTSSPLVQQCQKALNNISTWDAVGLFCVPDMLEYEEMGSLMSLRGAALFWGSLDLSWPWESLDEIYKKDLVVG